MSGQAKLMETFKYQGVLLILIIVDQRFLQNQQLTDGFISTRSTPMSNLVTKAFEWEKKKNLFWTLLQLFSKLVEAVK